MPRSPAAPHSFSPPRIPLRAPTHSTWVSTFLSPPSVISYLCLHLWSPLCLGGSSASALGYDPELRENSYRPASALSSPRVPSQSPVYGTEERDPSHLQAAGAWKKGPKATHSMRQGPRSDISLFSESGMETSHQRINK